MSSGFDDIVLEGKPIYYELPPIGLFPWWYRWLCYLPWVGGRAYSFWLGWQFVTRRFERPRIILIYHIHRSAV